MDAGNDAMENLSILMQEKVDFIIKRNLRREDRQKWLEIARSHGEGEFIRDGKTVYRGSIFLPRELTLEGKFEAFYHDGSTLELSGEAKMNVLFDPEKYWGCGLCANTCPSGAIVMERL